MKFSVIYSVDTPEDVDPLDYAPPHFSDAWDETEDDDQFEYGYLEGCCRPGRDLRVVGQTAHGEATAEFLK